MDPFVHLHVASGFSLRHGASHPHVLVERAADHGMDTLALTDRDGLYGAVRFVKACRSAGVRPVLGVDLAVAPVELSQQGRRVGHPAGHRRPRTPVRGGATVDPGLPRVTVLARDGRGWASLCRLVSATHLAGERGTPVTTLGLVARHARARAQVAGEPEPLVEELLAAGPGGLAGGAGDDADDGGLVVLLGPASELGRALAARRPDLAQAHLRLWTRALGGRAADGGARVVVEVVHGRGPGEAARAGRTLAFAEELGVPSVLTGAVRHADRSDAPVADVLDASRRLVALDARHVDRVNAEGYLKSGKEMADVAAEVGLAAGLGERGGQRLLARTRALADRCVVDPRADLGLGEVHLPELEVTAGRWAEHAAPGDPDAADVVLRARCLSGVQDRGVRAGRALLDRLDAELDVVRGLGYASYFLTVADVVEQIRGLGVRVAARGSGAGSLITWLTRVSDVDPLAHGLLMERFLSPLRHQLPDVDLDVEAHRRTEVYSHVLARYGGERCACVSMRDTYRARHALRDTGAALGLPPAEVDAIATSFPHVRASQLRAALRDLPELRASGIAESRLDLLLRLAERLDGLPRHLALHPCGVLLSDASLLDRTPVEASWLGFPMSQFDKDDVEDLGLLKLDLLGIRMQSAISHAVEEVARVDGEEVDVDAAPLDDPGAFALVQSTRTLGCFQIESPGQRELVGKFAPETFADLVVDISLFRPGPVKSDMVRPFLEARQGWASPRYPHPDLEPVLAETCGVVVFHEQVLQIVSTLTGCTLAEADEVRRALGDPAAQAEVRAWFVPAALGAGYALPVVEEVWAVLKAFGSFGFCKAHAAAFALPTYQSAWLKAHHPAAFLAGVLTHDPGMYPKRLILDDARQFGIRVLGLDVNRSGAAYRVERLPEPGPDDPVPPTVGDGLADGRRYGIRLALSEVKGVAEAEVAAVVAGQPYSSLADFWHRAGVARPGVERLVLCGAFDELHGVGQAARRRDRGAPSRRDLLLQVAELDTWSRAQRRTRRRAGALARSAEDAAGGTAPLPDVAPARRGAGGVLGAAARQSQAPAAVGGLEVQTTFDALVREEDSPAGSTRSGWGPQDAAPSGLPEMSGAEQVRAELEVLGLDASRHVVSFYEPLLAALGVVRARHLRTVRSGSEILVAGVKVATQTPPIRSGRRVVFVTLDDATGPVDATLFEDAQVGYASTVFHSWLLVVRGVVRRTGPRGVSVRATGCWELPALQRAWQDGGVPAAHALLAADPRPGAAGEAAVRGAADSRSSRPVVVAPPREFSTGFRQSPYTDVGPAGTSGTAGRSAPRKLWHSSPGSPGG